MSERDALLYRRCDEVLHYVWDPIAVSGVPEARDEYESYLPAIFNLVRTQVDEDLVARHLTEIEADRMSIAAQPGRAAEVASILANWRDWVWENVSE